MKDIKRIQHFQQEQLGDTLDWNVYVVGTVNGTSENRKTNSNKLREHGTIFGKFELTFVVAR